MSADSRDDGPAERRDRQASDRGRREGRPSAGERFSAWFATAAVRTGLTVIGLVVIVFALGQAVGFDLLGVLVDALTSRTGRWLVVAFFGLVLIVVAQRGLAHRG